MFQYLVFMIAITVHYYDDYYYRIYLSTMAHYSSERPSPLSSSYSNIMCVFCIPNTRNTSPYSDTFITHMQKLDFYFYTQGFHSH